MPGLRSVHVLADELRSVPVDDKPNDSPGTVGGRHLKLGLYLPGKGQDVYAGCTDAWFLEDATVEDLMAVVRRFPLCTHLFVFRRPEDQSLRGLRLPFHERTLSVTDLDCDPHFTKAPHLVALPVLASALIIQGLRGLQEHPDHVWRMISCSLLARRLSPWLLQGLGGMKILPLFLAMEQSLFMVLLDSQAFINEYERIIALLTTDLHRAIAVLETFRLPTPLPSPFLKPTSDRETLRRIWETKAKRGTLALATTGIVVAILLRLFVKGN